MKNIKLFKLTLLCLFVVLSHTLFAQDNITGNIKDNTGESLPGVTVLVKGTSNGTVSDIDGKFSLAAPADGTLVFSFIGMTTQEVEVSGQKTFDITLAPSTIGVDEVVVTALGITREKKSLAYSVSEVNEEALSKAGNTNVVKSLDGRVSGVNFTSASTDPTGSVFVTIRGATDLDIRSSTAKSQPLYVVDGIPMGTTGVSSQNGADFGNLLSQLNPDDIESVSILKGASAGALYGSAAGNGVIMITTKSGKGGKKGIGVSVNTSLFWDVPFNFYETQKQYGVGVRSTSIIPAQGIDWGGKISDFTDYEIDQYNTITQRVETKYFELTDENRLEEFMQVGATQNYNASVTGNYDKGSFRFGLGKMSNVGVMPNNSTKRINANLSAVYKITKKAKISVNASYMGQYNPNKTSANSNVVELLTRSFLNHFQPISEMRTVWRTGLEGIVQNAPYYNPNGTPQMNNPYMYTHGEINTYRKDNFFGKAQLDIELFEPLSFMARTGINYNGNNYELKRAKGFAGDNNQHGRYYVSNGNGLTSQNDLMLVWNKDFGKITTNATLGYNYAYSNSYSYSTDANRLVRANDYSLNNAVAGYLTSNSGWGLGKSQSFYGTMQIGFANQLYLDLSGRNDWSGILEEDQNQYFYPSASLSWLANTTFDMPEYINLIKLRGGIAQVGHGIGKPRSNNTYSFNKYNYGDTKIVNIGGSLVDPEILPEVTTSYEGGIDLAFLDNRVSAEFTAYKKIHDNQQGNIPTSPGVGYGGMLTNVGTVEATGFEFSLGYNAVRTKDWNWDIGVNYSQVESVITELSPEYVPNGATFYGNGANIDIRLAQGEEIGTMWAARALKRMPEDSKYAGMLVIDKTGTDWVYSSDDNDKYSIGNYNPDFILGMHSSVRWKNLRLGLVGSLRYGGQYVSDMERYAVTGGKSALTIGDLVNGPNDYTVGGRDGESGGLPWPDAEDMKYQVAENLVAQFAKYGTSAETNDACYLQGVWLKPGGDPNNDADYIVNGEDPLATLYALPAFVVGQQYYAFAQTLLRDATNFKLREVTLDYTIPAKFTRKLKMENVVVGFVGRNIFQWNKNGMKSDPESAFSGIGSRQGVISKAMPSIGSYGFKLSFDF